MQLLELVEEGGGGGGGGGEFERQDEGVMEMSDTLLWIWTLDSVF